MSSVISTNLIKKTIPYPAIYSLAGTPKTRTHFAAIKVADNNPPEISLKTTPAVARKLNVPQEVPRTPNVPDFDPIPPEKPANPPPLSPNPAPDFPEIQPPGPDMPVPPNTPEVVPPTTPPEWMSPNPSGQTYTRSTHEAKG